MQTKEVMQPNIIEACAIPSSVETDSSSSNYMFLGTIIQRIIMRKSIDIYIDAYTHSLTIE